MRRRDVLGMPAAALLGSQARPAEAPKPNIIFILADDLGYGDLGCYGQREIQTPNLDRMASEGLRFTQAYAGSTVCAPSRCCLMTGKHTGHATVRGNVKPEAGLLSEEPTVASLLKTAGYRTALFGKWGLGGPGTGSVPNTRGFDEFYGYLDQQHAHNSYPEHLWENQNEVFLVGNWFNQRKHFTHDLFTERALKFVAGAREPFFLYLAYTVPHTNNELGAVTGNGMETPDDKPYSDRPWPQAERNFAALVTRMDADIGRLFAALKQAGRDENTLVIFSSDNGPHQEGGHKPEFFRSTGPLRGIKRDLYEGGIRVPYLARWPGRIPAGRTSDEVVTFWDFLPTAAQLAGVPVPRGLDGISTLAAHMGRPQTQRHEYLYWEFHERGFAQAVRFGNWKCFRRNPGMPVEVYDLAEDLGEQNNIASKTPDVVRRAEELFRTARTDSERFPVRPSKG
ncbi:MAG: arylsulfatase [Bryobacteraceae bacterium]|nr:arylsulfatase [Bryobacteraceae bacterium]